MEFFQDIDVPGPSRDFVGYGPNPPEVRWPNGASVAVNFCVAAEEGAERSIPSGDLYGESLGGARPEDGRRDLAMESIFEYGSRAGIWRLTRLFDEYRIPVTFFSAATVMERNPALADWVGNGAHDVCTGGYRHIEPYTLTLEQERESISRCVESLSLTTGKRPIGWRSRTGPSPHTRELLRAEGGFVYDSDSYADDLPYYVDVNGLSQLVIPYTLTYTEGRLVQPLGFTSPQSFWETCSQGLDELRREGLAGSPKMLSIGLHPRHTGQAGRMAGLRVFVEKAIGHGDVWFATRGEIARHWLENHPYQARASDPAEEGARS